MTVGRWNRALLKVGGQSDTEEINRERQRHVEGEDRVGK